MKVIANGENQFLIHNGRGGLKLINGIENVTPFKSEKFMMALYNTIPRKYKKFYEWQIVDATECSNPDNDGLIGTYDLSKFQINIEDMDLNELSNSIKENSNKLKLYYNRLQFEINQNILKLRDIRHKIENINMSACDGYLLCKQMQDYLRERRALKNNAEKCKKLFESNLSIIADKGMDQIFEGIDSQRKYIPRILDNIFDD